MDLSDMAAVEELVRRTVARALAERAVATGREGEEPAGTYDQHGGMGRGIEVGEAGMRGCDSFRWIHTGSGSVAVSNVVVAFNGVAAGYAGDTVSVASGTKYVCAKVTWNRDEETDEILGISSVAISAEDSFASASMAEEDGSGVRIPLYALKKLETSGVDEVVCVADYVHGTAWALGLNTDDWEADAEDAEYGYMSVDRIANPLGAGYPDIVTLYEFEEPTEFDMRYDGHASWSADKAMQKVLVRYDTGDGVVVRYANHNPMPPGDATNVAAMWDDTGGGWIKKAPVDPADDESGTAIGSGDRVVYGAQKGTNGLIQLKTKPMGELGLTADDFESIDVFVPTSNPLWDSSGKQLQLYKRTVKVLKTSGSETASQAMAFAAFND